MGPFFSSRHGPSNIFDFTAVAAAETDSQSQKKRGNGERMRLGDGRRSGGSVIYIYIGFLTDTGRRKVYRNSADN